MSKIIYKINIKYIPTIPTTPLTAYKMFNNIGNSLVGIV